MDQKEIQTILNGFEKRMKFINIMQTFIKTSFPDNIRAMINGNSQLFTNIVIAVMVYIEEKTLGINQSCSLEDITEFVEGFSGMISDEYTIEPSAMARYIVVEVLQNGGIPINFLSYDSVKNSFVQMPVRIIDEDKGKYYLTNEAFDFMFRTKEIESELDYSVTRFRMQEYMKRDNYTQAMNESRELIRRIRNMMNDMEDFIRKCKENISQVAEDRYEQIMKRTSDLLDEEYKQLTDIKLSAQERKNNMHAAAESGIGSEDISKQYNALAEIIRNIQTTIEEQRGLINKKQSLSESYEMILQDSFNVTDFERINFENDILLPLRTAENDISMLACRLMNMFSVPEFEKYFSIENFYMPQNRIDETVKEDGIDLTEDTEEQVNISEIRNDRNLSIISGIIDYVKEHRSFKISEYVLSLSEEQKAVLCEENGLPNILVSLYTMQSINIGEWLSTDYVTIIPDGEFELSWCLNEIKERLSGINKLVFDYVGEEFTFSFSNGKYRSSITMNDYKVEVI